MPLHYDKGGVADKVYFGGQKAEQRAQNNKPWLKYNPKFKSPVSLHPTKPCFPPTTTFIA